jgi:putative glutamine amidotransferase
MEYFLLRADGIVIGGGEDVNPALYGKPEYLEVCGKVDDFRDSIEGVLIRFAFNNGIPLLGICRGQQMINVVAGGTLIPDLPTYKPGPIVHRNESDSAHTIYAESGSWLAGLIGQDTVWVNSRHHQSVDEVSQKFRIAAFAPDGVIESIEIKPGEDHPFAIAVQWHPESLYDSLSFSIGRLFLASIKK